MIDQIEEQEKKCSFRCTPNNIEPDRFRFLFFSIFESCLVCSVTVTNQILLYDLSVSVL